jgi:hypothetical protein
MFWVINNPVVSVQMPQCLADAEKVAPSIVYNGNHRRTGIPFSAKDCFKPGKVERS